MVGPADLSNAVGLNSASFNLARLVGPALSGFLIAALGSGVQATGLVILLNGVSYGAVIGALQLMRAARARAGRPGAARQGDDPRRRPLRAQPSGPEADPVRGVLRRHLRDELPDDLGADGHPGLPQGPGGVRPARHHPGRRLAHRRAARRPAGGASAPAAGRPGRPGVRLGRGPARTDAVVLRRSRCSPRSSGSPC